MSGPAATAVASVTEEVLVFPASSGQRRLWYLDQAEPGGSAYNVPKCVRVRGDLDVEALAFAFGEVTRRHEVLRTTFELIDGEPMQVVHEPRRFTIRVEDLSAGSPGAREAEAVRLAREEACRPFDLAQGPLLRVRLLRLQPCEHVLVVTMHHIVCDGWSMGVLFGEVAEFYNAQRQGRAASVPDLAAQYGDFSVWEQEQAGTAAAAQALQYWTGKLAGAPPLNLPIDHPRPARPTMRGATVSGTLPSIVERAQALARRHDVTPFTAYLAILAAVLHRWTGDEDIVIGAPMTDRSRVEFEPLIGFFVNTAALRLTVTGDMRMEDLFRQARATTVEAFRHAAPFDRVVEALRPERKGRTTPLVQVMMALDDEPGDAPAMDGLSFGPFPIAVGSAKFDMTVYFAHAAGGVSVDVTYSTDLFDEATAQRMVSHCERVLVAAIEDPAVPISRLPLLSPSERQTLVTHWNRTEVEYPRDATIPQLIDRQARRHPGRVAIADGERRLTYEEVTRSAGRLACDLRANGVHRGVPVSLCLRRSAEMITAMLAVLEAGGVYVPLDPAQPPARLAQMAGDAGSALVVTDEEHRHLFAGAETAPAASASWFLLRVKDPEANPVSPGTPNGGDPAYIIYTSGSTGRPKGVVVPHRAIARLVLNTNYVELGERDVVAQVSNAAFDAATFEIWGALLTGASIAVLPTEAILSAGRLAAEIRRAGVTTMFLTTALFNQLAREDPTVFGSLRYLLFGGEAADADAAAAVLKAGRPEHLLNVYGPTETTTFATFFEIRGEGDVRDGVVPIGKAIANTTLYVLDRHMTEVPIGVRGELYIGGDGVACGYHYRPELDAARFIADPFALDGRRLYRTGDLVRYRPDGNLEFLGRLDNQVKVRGFRVEPGEIEAALRAIDGVDEACVLAEKEGSGTVRLVAYVGSRSPSLTAATLRDALKRELPHYMVPAEIVMLDSLPLNANGKLDRAELGARGPKAAVAEAAAAADPPRAVVGPRDPLEAMLVEIWESLLGAAPIGVHDDFFDLGGHSLLAARMLAEAERAVGRRLPLSALLEHATIESLADALVRVGSGESAQDAIVLNGQGRKRPLVFLHGDINGGGLYTRTLARHMDPDRPLIVIASPGTDGRPMPASIESIAAMQTAMLRAAQPSGPYLLGGYCNGGLAAFEMARQLRRCGEQVSLVAIVSAMAARTSLAPVDSALRAWAKWREAPEAERVELFVSFDEFLKQLRRRSAGERVAYLASKTVAAAARVAGRGRPLRASLPPARANEAGRNGPRHDAGLFEAYSMAVGSYVPRRYDGRVALLLPAESRSLRASAADWHRVVPRLSIHSVDGDHVTCVTRHVSSLAAALEAAIRQAEGIEN